MYPLGMVRRKIIIVKSLRVVAVKLVGAVCLIKHILSVQVYFVGYVLLQCGANND